jgi:hypothetical protein
MFWKDDWDEAKSHLEAWWRGEGFCVAVTAPKAEPWEELPAPPEPESLERRWLDPDWRTPAAVHWLSRTYFGGEAFPILATDIGPGALGTFLGSRPVLMPTTVWYDPCLTDPEHHPPLRFDEGQEWWLRHLALVEEGLRVAEGRFLVGFPDLIENLDTLAALRGTEEVLMDLTDRPRWVKERLAEINEAFYQAFDRLYEFVGGPESGNVFGAFQLWGPGRTAKVQCDISALMGPDAFAEFVVPPLAEQCAWLDFSLFHLDGSQCLRHLDLLLGIEHLNAIEFTPEPGRPGGGSPHWYDLYRRILEAGKGVQAVGVQLHEVEPLLEAVGPEGLYLLGPAARTEEEARGLLERVERFR